MKKVKLFESFIAEANRGKVHKAAKQGSYPAVIVVVQDGKVIHQEPVSTPEVAPATFNVMQEKYPKALIHLEDKTGKRLFSESIITEAKYNKKSLLKAMTQNDGDITTTDGKEYVVYKYSYNRRLNDTIWQDDVVMALDQDGEEWEIKYSDIASYNESLVNEAFQNGSVEELHFEVDPKRAEELKIALGKKQGETNKKRQIDSAEYSLRRFRKEIKYGDGKNVDVFLPGSYDASASELGNGPHTKAVKPVKWNQRKYDQWLKDMAANGGAFNAFDMAQNAKNEPGLIYWVTKEFRGEDPMQRIQWDIEAFA